MSDFLMSDFSLYGKPAVLLNGSWLKAQGSLLLPRQDGAG